MIEKIVFDSQYMMLCTLYFTYEGNSDFISLVTGEEAIELNKKYKVTRVNQMKIFYGLIRRFNKWHCGNLIFT